MASCSVLIVDDEKDFVHTLLKRLKRRGLECEGVFTGEEAIETVKSRQFNIVLLDMKLPGRDGNSTLVEIKKIQPDAEVIILTGHASADDGIAGMKNGAMDYLMKPVEFESLLEMLLKAVRKTDCSHSLPVRDKGEK
ncbi:MAG: response regulator [Nitrospirae bacterium]|nr:MAG: response regulator [Nitrospirota bacterium]